MSIKTSYREKHNAYVKHVMCEKEQPKDYTDRYKDDGDLYNLLSYGSPYVNKGIRFAAWLVMDKKPGNKILCVGCGEGYEVVKYLKEGFDAYGTELHSVNVPYLKGRVINAQVPNLPFEDNEFDFLSCTEVLEHIEENLTTEFLIECKRVAKAFFFSIATEPDGYGSHINLHGISWWYDKFIECGFEIKNMQLFPVMDISITKTEARRISYGEGVTVLANKDIQGS